MNRRIGTANIKVTLTESEALQVLRRVLNQGAPGILGVQEWDHRVPTAEDLPDHYQARRPLAKGGKLVVWDTRRYTLLDLNTQLLTEGGRVGILPGRRSYLGPNYATVARFFDKVLSVTFTVAVAHLTAEVQINGHYRRDPAHALRVRRHKREMKALTKLGANYVVGDLNFDGLTHLGPLIACWVGHRHLEGEGTLLGRAVDYVFGPNKARHVKVIPTASDHHAVIATARP